MTDILVFLQEKDQRFIFASLVSYFAIKYLTFPGSCDTVKRIVCENLYKNIYFLHILSVG